MHTPVQFYRGVLLRSGRLGIFPGAFNPVTLAHLAVARAALDQQGLDQVVFLLPRTFPHKEYAGASFDERVALLEAALGEDLGAALDGRFAIASSAGGLFIEIAREFRTTCGDGVEIYLISGRDAAERIVDWDYRQGPDFSRQLEEFEMLVASREGEYVTPTQYTSRIHLIRMPSTYNDVSSSAVRDAIASGENWEELVSKSVADEIKKKRLYRP